MPLCTQLEWSGTAGGVTTTPWRASAWKSGQRRTATNNYFGCLQIHQLCFPSVDYSLKSFFIFTNYFGLLFNICCLDLHTFIILLYSDKKKTVLDKNILKKVFKCHIFVNMDCHMYISMINGLHSCCSFQHLHGTPKRFTTAFHSPVHTTHLHTLMGGCCHARHCPPLELGLEPTTPSVTNSQPPLPTESQLSSNVYNR